MIVVGPGVDAGAERTDVVEHIDLAATSLGLCGIEIPDWMQSQDILGEDYEPRKYAFAARDRCDETVDHIRCVRSERYKYIRNFLPDRPYLQPNNYKDNKPIQATTRKLHAEGKLDGAQSLVMADSRPVEELYDLQADPHELKQSGRRPVESRSSNGNAQGPRRVDGTDRGPRAATRDRGDV